MSNLLIILVKKLLPLLKKTIKIEHHSSMLIKLMITILVFLAIIKIDISIIPWDKYEELPLYFVLYILMVLKICLMIIGISMYIFINYYSVNFFEIYIYPNNLILQKLTSKNETLIKIKSEKTITTEKFPNHKLNIFKHEIEKDENINSIKDIILKFSCIREEKQSQKLKKKTEKISCLTLMINIIITAIVYSSPTKCYVISLLLQVITIFLFITIINKNYKEIIHKNIVEKSLIIQKLKKTKHN